MESTRKYICFFDILGFKDLVNNNPHSVLNAIYEKLFEGSSNDVISRWTEVKRQHRFVENKLDIAIISDSIILYSKDSTQKSFTQMILFARKLLQNAFYSGIPLRGAITIGEITARNTSVGSFTIYGRGIVDAYVLEESQNWSGCLISPEAIAQLEDSCKGTTNAGVNEFEQMHFIIKQDLRLKNQASSEFNVINWLRFFNPEFGEINIRQSFTQLNKQINPKVQTIIENTIEFYLKVKNNS